MKRLTALLLALITLLSVFPAGVFASEITEDHNGTLSDNISFETVTQKVGTDASSGSLYTMDISFDEADTVTKAMWISQIISVYGLTLDPYYYPENYYPDVTNEHEYYDSIQIATHYGLIDTPPGENFEPDSTATREFIASTANLMLGFAVMEETYSFSDEFEEGYEYKNDLQVAVERSWFELSAGKVLPSQAITAAEAQKVINDMISLLEDESGGDESDEIVFKDNVKVIENYVSAEKAEKGVLHFTDLQQDISANDIIAVYLSSIPSVYQVTGVSKDGNVTVVTGDVYPLYDAIDDINMKGSSSVGLENIVSEEEDGVIYVFEDGVQTTSSAYAKARAKDQFIISNVQIPIKGVKIATGVTASGNIDIRHIVVDHDLGLLRADISVYSDVSGSVTIKGDPLKLAGLNGKFAIPGVALDLDGVGSMGLFLTYQLSGSVTYSLEAEIQARLIAEPGSLRMPFSKKNIDSGITTEATASAGVELSVNIDALGIIDGRIFAQAGVRAKYYFKERLDSEREKYDTETETCEDYLQYAYVEAGYKLSAFGKPVKENTNVIVGPNDKICYKAWHLEDSQYTGKCSFGDNETYYSLIGGSNGFIFPSWLSNKVRRTGSGGAVEIVQIFEYDLNDSGQATITGCNYATFILDIPAKLDGHDVIGIGDGAFDGTNIRTLKIPEGVTSIGHGAFSGCKYLNSIEFPSTLTHIEGDAFANCTSLISVTLPDALTTLHEDAFESCSKLSWVYIPKNIVDVDSSGYSFGGPFTNCSALRTVKFAEGITNIPEFLFAECTGLREITIPDTVTTINGNAFSKCVNLHTVNWSDNITSIGDYAFQNCTSLTEVVFPSALTFIGHEAYSGCTGLTSVTFGNALEHIEAYAFNNCTGLTELTLPESLDKMHQYTFGNCTNLKKVFIPKSLDTVETGAYTSDGPFAGCSALTEVEFEEGVTAVTDHLFSACSGIKEITIPATVTTIEEHAFRNCDNLTKINFSANIASIGDYAFVDCNKLTEVTLPAALTSVGHEAFARCNLLEKVTFNDKLINIDGYAFSDTALTEVILPKSLNKMHQYSFGNCTSLKKVFIPKSLNSIETGAYTSDGPFAGCSALTEVEFEEGVTAVTEHLFAACSGIREITIPDTVTAIGDHAFYKATGLETITFGENSALTSVGSWAINGAAKLKKIALPENLNFLGHAAFAECTLLEEVTFLGNKITDIPESGFSNCSSLKKINIPTAVRTIGNYAFNACKSLTEIILPEGLTKVNDRTFINCHALESVTLPSTLTTIGVYAFENNESLREITIPDSVTSIETGAFYSCESLTAVNFGEGLIKIKDNAFMDCPKLDNVVIPKGIISIESETFKNNTSLVSVTIPQTVTGIGTEAFSYNNLMTVYGCKGSYAESWAAEMGFKFVDITNNLIGFAVVDKDGNALENVTVYRGEYFVPELITMANDDTKDFTDVLEYSVSSNAVQVRGTKLYANYTGEATVTVTAVTADGTTNIEEVTFTVTVIDIQNIEVTAPTKTKYAYGEELDLAGMVVTAVYTDGSKKEVTDYNISGYDSSEYGIQTVTVEFGGKRAAFNVEVVDERILVETITVEKLPDKVAYLLRESLDTTGIVVKATMNDGSTADVSADKLTYSNPNVLTEGVKTITVTYTGEDVKDTDNAPQTTFEVTYYKEIPTVTPETLDAAIEELYNKGVTTSDITEVEKLVKDYESLTDAAKLEVQNVKLLEELQYQAEGITAAADIVSSVDALYAKGQNSVTDAEVYAVEKAYNDLPKEFKGLVTNYDKLEEMLSWFAPDVLLGDVNGDGMINALDATQILRFANGKTSAFANMNEAERKACGDVNGDGMINALDATQILRFANGKSSVFKK